MNNKIKNIDVSNINKQKWAIENDLSLAELILTEYAIIEYIEKGYVWLENCFLEDTFPILKMKSDTISRKINNLINKNILNPFSNEEIVKILKNKSTYNKNKGIGGNVCEWCKGYTTKLHKHHYPIPRKDGGKEIVNICPNCHYEFHMNNFFRINVDKVYKFLGRE